MDGLSTVARQLNAQIGAILQKMARDGVTEHIAR